MNIHTYTHFFFTNSQQSAGCTRKPVHTSMRGNHVYTWRTSGIERESNNNCTVTTLSLTNYSPNIVQRISSTSFGQSLLNLRVLREIDLFKNSTNPRGHRASLLDWLRVIFATIHKPIRANLLLLFVFSVFGRFRFSNLVEKRRGCVARLFSERGTMRLVQRWSHPTTECYDVPHATSAALRLKRTREPSCKVGVVSLRVAEERKRPSCECTRLVERSMRATLFLRVAGGGVKLRIVRRSCVHRLLFLSLSLSLIYTHTVSQLISLSLGACNFLATCGRLFASQKDVRGLIWFLLSSSRVFGFAYIRKRIRIRRYGGS